MSDLVPCATSDATYDKLGDVLWSLYELLGISEDDANVEMYAYAHAWIKQMEQVQSRYRALRPKVFGDHVKY